MKYVPLVITTIAVLATQDVWHLELNNSFEFLVILSPSKKR